MNTAYHVHKVEIWGDIGQFDIWSMFYLCQPWIPYSKKNIKLASIRHQSDTFMSDRCLIDVDLRVFAVWDVM